MAAKIAPTRLDILRAMASRNAPLIRRATDSWFVRGWMPAPYRADVDGLIADGLVGRSDGRPVIGTPSLLWLTPKGRSVAGILPTGDAGPAGDGDTAADPAETDACPITASGGGAACDRCGETRSIHDVHPCPRRYGAVRTAEAPTPPAGRGQTPPSRAVADVAAALVAIAARLTITEGLDGAEAAHDAALDDAMTEAARIRAVVATERAERRRGTPRPAETTDRTSRGARAA